jgi:uncharacterized protein YlxW (UPF0749 family)
MEKAKYNNHLFCINAFRQATRMKDQLLRKVKGMELSQKEVEEQKEALRVEITSLEREIESYQRITESDKKQFEDLQVCFLGCLFMFLF